MKLWMALVNSDASAVDAYLRDLLDAVSGVAVEYVRRSDHQWATLIEVELRLCDADGQRVSRADASDCETTYSGWLREPHGAGFCSSFRDDAPVVDPTAAPTIGEFSYASIRADRLVLATDHYATHPIYYWRGPGGQWAASNDLRLLLLCRSVPLAINHASCLELLTQSVMVGENELADAQTFFAGVMRMPPASVLTIAKTGREFRIAPAPILPSAYSQDSMSRREDYEAAFRACLDACVLDRLKAGASGLMLSGGVDSNTVLGASLSVQNDRVPFCANMSFKNADLAMSQDDKLVEALIEHCGLPHRIIYADDFLRLPALDDACAYIDGPDAAANPLAKEACARTFQDHGVSLAMTGEGGDLILGESSYAWIHDAIRKHDGIGALHSYLTKNLGNRAFSSTYIRKMLASILPRFGRREWLREQAKDIAPAPSYLNVHAGQFARRNTRSTGSAEGSGASPRASYLGHEYVQAMLFPRASYFDTLNVYCTHSHPFLDPRMISFALACPPHMHHDYRRLKRENPYATSKMLARNAYRDMLPRFATEKNSKTSYALMARKMFHNSAKALLRLTDEPMTLGQWGFVDQPRFRQHLIAYIVATEDPNAQLGCQYHYIRGVTDLELWLRKFSGPRSAVVEHLRFRPLRALAG